MRDQDACVLRRVRHRCLTRVRHRCLTRQWRSLIRPQREPRRSFPFLQQLLRTEHSTDFEHLPDGLLILDVLERIGIQQHNVAVPAER